MEVATDKWQELMDGAYEKWRTTFHGKKYTEFLFQLTGPERIAVLLGNLNYQVGNGGHRQWVDNGYALQGRDAVMALTVVMEDEGTTPEERGILKQQIENIESLLSFVDLSVKDRGFGGDYWLNESEDEDSEDYHEGQVYANSLDDWYYDTFTSVALPAIERYFVKLAT